MPLVLTVAGSALYVLMADSLRIECTKTSEGRVDCRIRTERLGCITRQVHVSDVREARVETADPEPRRLRREPGVHVELNRTFRVSLVDGQGRVHPTSRSWTSDEAPKEKVAEAIRDFIGDPESRSSVVILPRTPWALVALVLPILGVHMTVAGRGECTLDRSLGLVRLKRWTPIGPRMIELPLGDVRSFQVLCRRGHGGVSWCVGVVRTTGEEIPLTHMSGPRSEKMVELASVLEAFRSTPLPVSPAVVRPATAKQKICVVCGVDCSDSPRLQDHQGHYFHQACYDQRRDPNATA